MMKTQADYFAEYAESHQNRKNILIHKVCVPAIEWSVFAVLWTVKMDVYNLAWVVWTFGTVFYFRLKFRTGIYGGGMALLMLASIAYLEQQGAPLLPIGIGVFVIAWIGQFIGHAIEGKKPSFIQDLKFLLIGPIWVIKGIL